MENHFSEDSAGASGRDAAEKKKPRGREARLQYIKKGENGQYRYEGSLYTYSDGKGGAGVRAKLCALWALAMASAAAGGLIPAGSMQHSFYVLLPYVLHFVAAAGVGMRLLPLAAAGQVREYVYEAAKEKIPFRALAASICAALAAAGGIVHMALHGISVCDALFVCLETVSLTGAASLRRKFLELRWSRTL